jgi:hypothetical protein
MLIYWLSAGILGQPGIPVVAPTGKYTLRGSVSSPRLGSSVFGRPIRYVALGYWQSGYVEELNVSLSRTSKVTSPRLRATLS